MNLLVELNQRHPTGTAIVGTLSSLSGWFFANLPELNGVAMFIGTVLGLLIAVITLALKVDAWVHRSGDRRAAMREQFHRDRWEEDNIQL